MSHYYLVFLLYFSSCQSVIAQQSVSSAEDPLWLNLLPSFQEQQPKFKWLTPNDGLSHGHVVALLKDHQGFMWIATEEGLNKYDGYSFTAYKHDPKISSSVSHSFVRSLLEDQDSNLWVGTESGLDRFDRKKEVFIHYPLGSLPIIVRNIFRDRMNQIWLGTSRGLHLLHPANGTFKRFPFTEKDPNSLGHHIFNIVQDNEGHLWLSTPEWLSRFNPQTEEFTYYFHDPRNPNSIGSNWITTVYIDSKGYLWIGTRGGGLALFDRKKNTFLNFRHDPTRPNTLANNDILSIVEDNDGKLWIGTETGGISVFDYAKNSFVTYQYDATDNTSLSSNSIHSLYKDDVGNIWAGTWANGINLLSRFGNKFAHYRHMASNKRSLTNSNVTTIAGDRDGNIFIGTDGGGLNILDRRQKTILHYRHDVNNPNSIKSDFILAVTEASPGILAVGYHRVGFDLLAWKTGGVTHLPEDNTSTVLPNKSVVEVYKDLWLGTYDGIGLFYFDRKSNSFTRYHHNLHDPHSLSGDAVNALLEDQVGNLWVGTNDGLDYFDQKKNQFIHHKADTTNPYSISNDVVHTIVEDQLGNLWIGTGRGLNCFDRKNRRFTAYTEQEGLANNTIYGILEDRHGNLWLSSNKGISKFNPVTKTCRNYDVTDGLQDNVFNFNAWYQTATGEIFFGGINGFNVFHPDSIRDNPFIPPVRITRFQIFNKNVPIGDDSPLHQAISETSEMTLSYKQSDFTLEFSALDYTLPEKNQYAYKLEGFDKTWNYVGTKRTATYTNLDAGDYVFKVKASNNDGVWNENGTFITIHITPPWWHTLWFRMSAGLAILGLGVGFYRLRIRAIKIQNRKLEKLVDMRTKELQIANLEIKKSNEELVSMEKIKENMLAVMSHEIRTPLNSVIGLAHVLKRRNPRPDQIEIIDTLKSSGDHLLHLVNDVLDYNKIQARKLDLEVLRFNLIDILKQLHSMFTRAAEEKNIHFNIQASTSLPTLLIGDPTRLLQILSNVVSNAIKFTNEGSVTLHARTMEESEQLCTIEFKVEDTGIGIPEDKLHLLYEPFSQLRPEMHRKYGGSGLGLLIVKNLVEAMKGSVAFESIPDKTTTVTVTIPFTVEHDSERHDQRINQPHATLKGLRILYTEDVKSNQFLVKTLLADHEIDCDIANDGNETIAKTSEQEFDVILLDIQLPDMDGYEVTARVRSDELSKNKKTPIVLFSAHTGINDEKIKSCGANDFIGKPFQPEDLLLKIERSVTRINSNQ